MNYQIIGIKDNYVYGEFPTKMCASLALKGMLTFMDGIEVRKITNHSTQEEIDAVNARLQFLYGDK
jgi:hypothetical protein